jgi:hypothetical protein
MRRDVQNQGKASGDTGSTHDKIHDTMYDTMEERRS